jgi:hypothetical protein
MKKMFSIYIRWCIIIIGCFLYACNHNSSTPKNTKYIAYIGRYTDHKESNVDKSAFDKLHELSLRKYLSTLDFKDTDLQLKVFDCKRSGAISDSIYEVIAKDTSIVAVIDNTWGEHISKCVSTIKNNNIPVVSINADKNNLDYGSQVIFTGNGDLLPYDIGAFLNKGIKTNEINFISEVDYPLHDSYLKAFQLNDIKIKNSIYVKGKNLQAADSIAFYQSLDLLYKDSIKNNTLTILNVHSTIGNHLLPYLDKYYKQLRLLGHSYIVNAKHLKSFGKTSSNQLILISNPTDALSKELIFDIDELKLQSPDLFENANHPMFVDRCMDAVALFKNYKTLYPNQSITRSSIINYFSNLKDTEFTENGEVFRIDTSNSVLPDLYFTSYTKGQLNSYPLQLNLEREIIPNLFFGIEIIDIYDIDINTNSFTSDFYYWIKMDSAHKDVEKYIVFQNMKQNGSSKELVLEKIDGPTIYKLYKVSGLFYVNYNINNFPFDEQELNITAEVLNPTNILKVSFDKKSLEVDSTIMDKFKINEWSKKRFYVTVENQISKGLHGDPEIDAQSYSAFKNISFRLQVERKVIGPLLEIILPLIMIGIVAIALLMIRNVTFENLGEVSIGVFITIVAYSISYSDSTPKTDNLTRADFLFWLTFMVVLTSFLIVIGINSLYSAEKVMNMNLRKMGFATLFIYIIGVFSILFF